MKAVFIVAVLALTAVFYAAAIEAKTECEAKGGKLLRGMWALEGFKCYDARMLKKMD